MNRGSSLSRGSGTHESDTSDIACSVCVRVSLAVVLINLLQLDVSLCHGHVSSSPPGD